MSLYIYIYSLILHLLVVLHLFGVEMAMQLSFGVFIKLEGLRSCFLDKLLKISD